MHTAAHHTSSHCGPPIRWRWLPATLGALLLAACGGAQHDSSASAAAAAPDRARALAVKTVAASDLPASRAEAARFLTQATFGPTSADIDSLMAVGYAAWIDRQFTLPATSHRSYWEARDAAIRAVDPTASAGQDQVWESFWKQAVNGEDQLRLRVAFALSQVFVISALDANVGNQPRAMAAWLDMLGQQAFGNYRSALENVALHPLMGFYLSHIRNQTADALTGRIPEQNFPRESMQLFCLGRPVRSMVPWVPIAAHLRVGIAMLSYRDTLTFGVTGDHESMPDLQVLADGIAESWSELAAR